MTKHLMVLVCTMTALFGPLAVPVGSAPQAAAKSEKPDMRTPEQKEIDQLIETGRLALRQSDYQTALTAYQSARAKAEAARESRRTAACLFNIGLILSRKGQIGQALEYHQQALEIREKENDQPGIASSLNSLGMLYGERDDPEKARSFLARALEINRKLGDEAGIAATFNNLGIFYNYIGEMEKALGCYQQSLTLKEKIGDEQSIAITLHNLGTLSDKLGQTEQALEYHQRALALKEKVGLPQSIANTLNNLGALYKDLGDPQQARACYQKALEIREKLGNEPDIAESLNNLGNLYFVESQWNRALEYHLKALAIREKLDDFQEIAMSYHNLGEVYKEMGQMDKALDYCRRAQEIWDKRGDPLLIAFNLANTGSIYARMNRTQEAIAYNLRALKLLETASLQLENPADLGNFQKTNLGNLYAVTAEMLSRTTPDAALAMLERGRAQGLARQMAGTEAFSRLLTSQDRASLQQQQNTLGRAASAFREIARQPVPASPDKKQVYERSLRDTRTAYADAQLGFTRFRSGLLMQPKYAELRRLTGVQPMQQAELPELSRRHPHTLYLEYAFLDDSSLLRVALQGGKLRVERLPCDLKKLERQVRDWRSEILRVDAYDRPREERLAHTVYTALLSGLKLDAAEQLIVVAEKSLLDVPFAALRDDQGRRLLDQHTISSAFSLASLTWPTREGSNSASLLCMADPTGEGGETHQSALRGGFGPLPRARQEGRAVAALIPGARILLGREAREAAVKAELGRYDLLHFATHAVADGRNGLLSGLILAPEPLESREDGVLLAEEIAGMSLHARLVVLSACETARGQLSGGEGLLGLGWAFRAAGVPAVVASQWRVDDSATESLMVDFYRELRAGHPKDAALRAAMLTVKRVRPNPFYWAAFQTLGDCSPLTSNSAPTGKPASSR